MQHQVAIARVIFYLYHDPSFAFLPWSYPGVWKAACFFVLEFSFLQRRPCRRHLPKGELSKLKLQPRFIPFFEVSDWLVGVKFQRWFKVAKMCATQICNAHLRKKWKYHICYRFCMVIVFNYWNANSFRPIEKFLSLCSLCETLKNILHA